MLRAGQTSAEIASVPTNVLLQSYADRVLVLVTQLGKVGALIQASLPSGNISLVNQPDDEEQPPAEASPYPPLPPPPPSITLTPLLGATGDQPLLSLYAAQIATLVWSSEADALAGAARPVVVGLALKGGEREDREVFHGIMKLVREVLRQE